MARDERDLNVTDEVLVERDAAIAEALPSPVPPLAPPSARPAREKAHTEAEPEVAYAAGAAGAVSLAAAALLAACGGGGSGDGGAPAPAQGDGAPVAAPGSPGAPAAAPAAPPTLSEAARFLAQASLGAPKGEIVALQANGYAAWIAAQFQVPRSQSHYDWMLSKGYASDESKRFSTDGMDQSIWRKLVSSPDLLRQRVTLALSEICVVSVNGVDSSWRQFAVASYLDILEANALGNYRDLLGQISLAPAMGYYLTFRGNAKANATGSQPDENYARELMQLFTIGLTKLNPDGTPQAAGGDSYGPADVTGLARVFTGWDLDVTNVDRSKIPPEVLRRPMTQNANRYETAEKKFLGTTIPAGTPAADAMKAALDTLFNHPNTAAFVSRQLIQRMVTSNPSPAYVGRVAGAFVNDGTGKRGEMKAVVRAILLDDEARSPATAANPAFGKLREPVQRFLNWARGFGATSASDAWAIGDLTDPANRLGQSPMRAPSVFNFFRPGYVPPNTDIATRGLAGPEFQITNESSVAGWVNYLQRVVAGQGAGDVRANYSSLTPLAVTPDKLLTEINLVAASGQVSDATLAAYKSALDTMPSDTDTAKLNRVYAGIVLVMASPEYITQK